MDAKLCASCGKTKPYSAYHKDQRAPDGYRGTCKVCRMNEGKAAKRQTPPTPRATYAPAPAGLFDAMPSASDGAPTPRQNALDPGDMGDDLDVEAPETASADTGGLFDQLMGAMKGSGAPSGPKQPKSVRDEQEAMAQQIATLAGYGISLGAALAIPDPYKPMAPQHAHAFAIVKPLAEILAEKMDMAGHLSPTMIRLGESALALLMYGDYAVRTYITIRAKEAQGGNPSSHSAALPSQPAGHAGPAASATAGNGDARPSGAGANVFALQAHGQERSRAGAAPGRRARHDGQDGAWDQSTSALSRDDTAGQAAAIDALLAADADGRRQLGIVG